MKCGTCNTTYVDDGTIRYRSVKPENFSAHIISLGGKECWYCGGVAESLIQVVPGSRGGCECVENLRAACGFCAASRWDMLHSEWRVKLRGYAPGRSRMRRVDDQFLDRVAGVLWHWNGE